MSSGYSLRIATYNLRGLKDDPATAAAAVRAIGPDVLLLQELPRYPGSDYAITSFAREARLLWSGRTRWVSGTGMMTGLRLLPTDSEDLALRVGLRENPRSFTLAQVRHPDGPPITVASIHLSLRAEQRVEHVRTVMEELDARAGGGSLVVGGDLNENSSGQAWGVLGAGLQEVGGDRPTYPAAGPRHRIDTIFSRGHDQITLGDPQLVEGMRLAAATDHLPVWVDLTFPGAPTPA